MPPDEVSAPPSVVLKYGPATLSDLLTPPGLCLWFWARQTSLYWSDVGPPGPFQKLPVFHTGVQTFSHSTSWQLILTDNCEASQRNFVTGGIGTCPVLFQLSQSLTPLQKNVPKVRCYSGSLSAAVVACSPTRTAPSPLAPLAPLVPFRVTFVVMLSYSMQYYRPLNLAIQCMNQGISTAHIRVSWPTLLWGYRIQYNFYEVLPGLSSCIIRARTL